MIFFNKIKHYLPLFLFVPFLLLTACHSKDEVKGAYEKGVFITNEGTFLKSNGEISFFNKGSKTATNNLFTTVNTSRNSLGDVVQSMAIYNDKAYIVLNNSNSIEIVDPYTFTSLSVINNINQPRYMVASGTTGYISEWVSYGDTTSGVVIIDLTTNTIQKRIKTGAGAENMVILSNKLYVTNSADSTVAVIDLSTQTVVNKITVGDSPQEIIVDKNNDIWILCGGKVDYPAPDYNEVVLSNGSLKRFTPNGNNLTAKGSILFPSAGGQRLILNPSKDKLYYNYKGKVYFQSIDLTTSANQNSTNVFINRDFYGIGIDPEENIFYGGYVPNYVNNGKMIRYNMSTGAAIDSVTVGIAPNGFIFR